MYEQGVLRSIPLDIGLQKQQPGPSFETALRASSG